MGRKVGRAPSFTNPLRQAALVSRFRFPLLLKLIVLRIFLSFSLVFLPALPRIRCLAGFAAGEPHRQPIVYSPAGDPSLAADELMKRVDDLVTISGVFRGSIDASRNNRLSLRFTKAHPHYSGR